MTPWIALLTPLIAVAAFLTIRAEYRGPHWLVYACKPLSTALILALALATGGDDRAYSTLIAAGLVCSLAGDIFLMLPQDRFIPGLVSFLLAHLAYIAAFIRAADRPLSGTSVLPLIPLLAYGLAVLAVLRPHLGPLLVPVLAYMLVILAMAWRAIEYAREYPALGSLAAAFGALLFVISDSALALNRFARPFRAAQALVLGTYFVAQWLIALS
ncbi:MAG: lysoplasmalogenase [Thermomicrobiales bacterium]